MRIGIDMRMAGTGEGIGRYVEQLVLYLADIDFVNEYFLLVRENLNLKIKSPKFQFVQVRAPYYSFAEQTSFVGELNKLHLDLVHFANFNVPIFYKGRFVTTIHDIIHHRFPGKKKSRFFHRLAYRYVIRSAINKARRVIAVSESTKTDIIKTFKTRPEKISVIYEGVDDKFSRSRAQAEIESVKQKYGITKPYLLFVGVWRQYKNLPRLAQAFDILKEQYHQNLQLVLAGKIDPFYPEIRQAVLGIKNVREVKALGFVSDDDLVVLYRGATAFVLPSLIEGFGLIGLEAQAAGVPVVASNIPVLKEVLGTGAKYFNPQDQEDMAKCINLVISDKIVQQSLIAAGLRNARRYDWTKTARQTLGVYEQVMK